MYSCGRKANCSGSCWLTWFWSSVLIHCLASGGCCRTAAAGWYLPQFFILEQDGQQSDRWRTGSRPCWRRHLQFWWAIWLIFCSISSDCSCSRVSSDRPSWSSCRRDGATGKNEWPKQIIHSANWAIEINNIRTALTIFSSSIQYGIFLKSICTSRWANLSERLSHLPQEVLGELDGLVHCQVQAAVADVLLNPARKLPAFVRSAVALRQDGTGGHLGERSGARLRGRSAPLTTVDSPCRQRSSGRSRFSPGWLGPRTGRRAAWRRRWGSRSPWSGSDPAGIPDEPGGTGQGDEMQAVCFACCGGWMIDDVLTFRMRLCV